MGWDKCLAYFETEANFSTEQERVVVLADHGGPPRVAVGGGVGGAVVVGDDAEQLAGGRCHGKHVRFSYVSR